MQISTKFTVAIHILMAAKYFEDDRTVTSRFLAESIGSNAVIVRNIMLQLQSADLIDVKRGPGGIKIKSPLSEIRFLDIYRAVETHSDESMFRFHEHPNHECPIGRNIYKVLDSKFEKIEQSFEDSLDAVDLQQIFDDLKDEE